jgi:transcriptional regulator with XRE-family HTH domain
MARTALGWSAADLGERAAVSRTTISRFELEKTEPNRATLVVLRQTFEGAGVEFLDGDQPGVRLKRSAEGDVR